MTTTATPAAATDAWTVAYDAALPALIAARARGDFSNSAAHTAIARSGLTVAEAREVTGSVVVAAADTIVERRAIIAALGDELE